MRRNVEQKQEALSYSGAALTDNTMKRKAPPPIPPEALSPKFKSRAYQTAINMVKSSREILRQRRLIETEPSDFNGKQLESIEQLLRSAICEHVECINGATPSPLRDTEELIDLLEKITIRMMTDGNNPLVHESSQAA